MMTLIWLACVLTTWTPSSGMPDGYRTETRELDGSWVRGADVASNRYVVCVPNKYLPTEFRVAGFNEDGDGVWSDPLILKRVHNFDGVGTDGMVGFDDFGKFINAFGYRHLPGGMVVEPTRP